MWMLTLARSSLSSQARAGARAACASCSIITLQADAPVARTRSSLLPLHDHRLVSTKAGSVEEVLAREIKRITASAHNDAVAVINVCTSGRHPHNRIGLKKLTIPQVEERYNVLAEILLHPDVCTDEQATAAFMRVEAAKDSLLRSIEKRACTPEMPSDKDEANDDTYDGFDCVPRTKPTWEAYVRSNTPRGERQVALVEALNATVSNGPSVVCASGPAGTGKTMLATIAAAMWLVGMAATAAPRKQRRLVMTRPVVAVDEELGFLPGGSDDKMAPWLAGILDVLHEAWTPTQVKQMRQSGIIEVVPLGFMRGRTFTDTFVLADEMQNTTPRQMKMLLTRIGQRSRFALTGDPGQVDLPSESGLVDFTRRFDRNDEPNSNHLAVIELDSQDVRRHPAVSQILRIYD